MKPLIAILLLLTFNSSLFAFQNGDSGNWPSWRGPTTNGHAAATANPPIQWSESSNVQWKKQISGIGNSTPSVWGNQIILTSAVATGRKANLANTPVPGKPDQIHEFFVISYDLDTGKTLWTTKVAEAVPHSASHPTGSFASASTVTDGKRIYAFFGSLGLYALNMDGTRLWTYKLPIMKTIANFGEGASPALHDNTLIVPWDEEGQSFVAGIDASTGKEIWKTTRTTTSTWSTPLIVKDGGKHLAVLSGTAFTRAYDVVNGKEIWSCGGMSSNPTSSPVADENVVYVGNTFRGKIIQAIRFYGASGDLTGSPNLLWTYRKSASYVPTPLLLDNKLFFLQNSIGILNCIDAKTGNQAFPARRIGLKNVHASPVVAANRIYILSREGDAVVIDPKQDGKILAKNHLDDVFDASPVAIGDSLILRGRRNLYHIRKPSS